MSRAASKRMASMRAVGDFAGIFSSGKRLSFHAEQSYSCPMPRSSTSLGAGSPSAGPAEAHLLYTKSECKLLTIGEQRFLIQITTSASILDSAPTKVIVFPKRMKAKKQRTTDEEEVS
jgi:hypothetical protein